MPSISVPAAIAIGAGVSATGAIAGGMMQSSAVSSAANTSAAAARDGQAIQNQQFTAAQQEQARQFEASQSALRTGTENANAIQTQQHDASFGVLSDASGRAIDEQRGAMADTAGLYSNLYKDSTGAINEGYTQEFRANEPFLTSGTSALNRLAEIYGLDSTDANGVRVAGTPGGKLDPNDTFYQSPDYQFQLSQGIKGVDGGAAARGMLDSGATRKAEIKYAGNLASGQFNTYAQRLAGLAGIGQTAAANKSTAATNYANSITGLNNSYGNQMGNLRTGTANNISNNLTGTADRIAGANSNYATQYGNAQLGQGTNLANSATSYGNNFANGANTYGNNYASSIQNAANNQANATLSQGASTANTINGLAGTAQQYLTSSYGSAAPAAQNYSTGYAGPGLYQNGMFFG